MSLILDLLSRVYGLGVKLRNAAYDRGLFASHDLGARTISIGNLTAGGTGKTPIVGAVARMLADHGERVCILSRGYGRARPSLRVLVSDGTTVLVGAAEGGDEPVELARRLDGAGVIVVADRDRCAAAEWAIEKFGITVFVLDDAFQHRRAKRDLDIVCIDATDPFGGDQLLPAGRLREPLAGLRRADALIITRSDVVDGLSELEAHLAMLSPEAELFHATTALIALTPQDEFLGPGDRTKLVGATGSIFAFGGLGNPAVFFSQLERADLTVAGTKAFPDHHSYSQKDIDDVHRAAADSGAGILVTTAKDAVKLDGLKFRDPCLVAQIEAKIDPESDFRRLLISSS